MKGVICKGFCVLLIIAGCCIGCNQAPNTAGVKTEQRFEQRVFVVNLVPDSIKVAQYLNYHQHIWPEVEAGFKKAGYKEITMSRFKNLLVMTVVVPKGASLDSMSKVAEASNVKCAEWNQLMGPFQTGVPGTAPGQKWVEATSFYHFENQ